MYGNQLNMYCYGDSVVNAVGSPTCISVDFLLFYSAYNFFRCSVGLHAFLVFIRLIFALISVGLRTFL